MGTKGRGGLLTPEQLANELAEVNPDGREEKEGELAAIPEEQT